MGASKEVEGLECQGFNGADLQADEVSRCRQLFVLKPLAQQGLNAADLAAGICEANAHQVLFAVAMVKVKLCFTQATLLCIQPGDTAL
jgi:hypothetical protein